MKKADFLRWVDIALKAAIIGLGLLIVIYGIHLWI